MLRRSGCAAARKATTVAARFYRFRNKTQSEVTEVWRRHESGTSIGNFNRTDWTDELDPLSFQHVVSARQLCDFPIPRDAAYFMESSGVIAAMAHDEGRPDIGNPPTNMEAVEDVNAPE
jgi:hypothetical protein